MKPKGNLPSLSLSWKLTCLFVCFGLLLSYISFIAFGAHSVRVVLGVGASMADEAFQVTFRDRHAGVFESLAGAPNDSFTALRRNFPFLAHWGAVSRLTLYGSPPGGGWFSFGQGSEGVMIRSVVPETDGPVLDKAVLRGTALNRGRVWNTVHATLPAYLGLRTASDGTRWAVGILIDQRGLFDFLIANRTEVLLFIAFLLVFSGLLGRFFATRFIRPLNSLAQAASSYATGASVSFHSQRRDEVGVLSRTLDRMRGEIDRRRRETENRLQAMVAMNHIDKAVLSTTSRAELLDRVAEIVNGVFSAQSVAIVLRDESRGGWAVEALTGGRVPTARPFIPDGRIDPETLPSMTGYYEAPVSEYGPNFAGVAGELLDASEGRLVWCPLFMEGTFLGSLVVLVDRETRLTLDERRTINMLADQTAVALRSIFQNEAKEDNFLGILRSLSRAIDAKSRWTAGHSERVADIAVRIGETLRLPEVELASLRIAAILHDVGKLGVSESILDKAGKLDDEEYAQIKRHPSMGGEILRGIRSFEAIVPAIVHHHERWDGRGYPDALSGDGIPLAARIITVADVWDAITDDRPYRAGFPEDRARAFMIENSELMFDPRIVRAFLNTSNLAGK